MQRLRNIGIVAHIDAGKTTVSERILFYSGVERRMGEVHEGTATLDWMEEERKRGITITAAATTVPWREHTIHLIDTPGHVDFTVEVERCMRVLDGAVLVVNAVAGVQAQSETVWRQMKRHGVKSIAFVNQHDRPGADFFRCVKDLREKLQAPAIPVQYPIGEGREFRALVDLVSGEAFEFPDEDFAREPRSIPVPEEVRDEVGVLRAELIEALAEEDEDVMTSFLEEREPETAALQRALRARVLAGTLMPVLCGAALRNVGVQLLLDAIVEWLPSPDEVPPIRGTLVEGGEVVERPPLPDGPLCALAFKLVADPHEDLVFTRIYSGTLKPGQKVFNPRVGRMERISRVLHMHADTRRALESAGPGEIVALTGAKQTVTGDTLCEHDDALLLERVQFPPPVISRVVEPAATDDRDKLRAALDRLAFEDPSFVVREKEDTGQWLIAGMGELHLEIKEHRLAAEFHLAVNVGEPRVEYREALVRSVRASGQVDRTLGGTRVQGTLELELAPLGAEEREAEHRRVRWAPEATVAPALRAPIEEALLLGVGVGPRFGFPLEEVVITVLAGEPIPERESELGYVQAASLALKNALGGADVAVLEPVMEFDIAAPAEFMSGIIGELNAKRAEIADLAVDGSVRRVTGQVPLATMFGYATTLRSLSQGRAEFSLSPAGYRRVPEGELEARGLVWS